PAGGAAGGARPRPLRGDVLPPGGGDVADHGGGRREPPLPRHAPARGGAGRAALAGFKRERTDMNRRLEMDLMRLLHGELPPDRARELTARMAREPELADRYRRLGEGWQGLAAPPEAPAAPGLPR